MPTQNAEIKRVFPLEERGSNGFKIGRFHASWECGTEKYPRTSVCEFKVLGKSAESIMKKIAVGAKVEIEYAVEGREWSRSGGGDPSDYKCFNDLVVRDVKLSVRGPDVPADLPDNTAVKPYDPSHKYNLGDLCYYNGRTVQLSPTGNKDGTGPGWVEWTPPAKAAAAAESDMSELPF